MCDTEPTKTEQCVSIEHLNLQVKAPKFPYIRASYIFSGFNTIGKKILKEKCTGARGHSLKGGEIAEVP